MIDPGGTIECARESVATCFIHYSILHRDAPETAEVEERAEQEREAREARTPK